MKISEIVKHIDELAPVQLSKTVIDMGWYDNSGLLVDMGGETDSVVFTLDMCYGAVELAKKVGAKLIVTHHPAIYHPIKSIVKSPTNKVSIIAPNPTLVPNKNREYSVNKTEIQYHGDFFRANKRTIGAPTDSIAPISLPA